MMLIGLLPAQYDEKQVLSQQAYQMMARRQYNEAEQLSSSSLISTLGI